MQDPRQPQVVEKEQGARKPPGAPEHTPLMKQFFAAKSEYPDLLLFFRMAISTSCSTTTRAKPRACSTSP